MNISGSSLRNFKLKLAAGIPKYGVSEARNSQKNLVGNQSECLSCPMGDYTSLIFWRKRATDLKLIVVLSCSRTGLETFKGDLEYFFLEILGNQISKLGNQISSIGCPVDNQAENTFIHP